MLHRYPELGTILAFRLPKAQQDNVQGREEWDTHWPLNQVPRGCLGTTCKQVLPKTAGAGKERGKWAPDKSIPEVEVRVEAVFHGTPEHRGYQRQGRTEAGAGCRVQASSTGHREPGTGFISTAASNSKQRGHCGAGRSYLRATDQRL